MANLATPKKQSAQPDGENKLERLLLALIVLLAAVLCALMLNGGLTVVNLDSAIFYLLGKALATGQGYVLLSEPNPQPYFTFPPLLPLQIAGILTLLGPTEPQTAQLWIKGYIHLLFLVAIPFYFALLRSQTGRWSALILTMLLALNPLMYRYSADILSDVPYWAMSCIALFYFSQWQSDLKEASRKTILLALVFLAASLLTRQMGMALGLAIVASFLLQKAWKPFVLSGLVMAACLLGWQGYEHHYRSTHEKEADGLNQAGVQAVLDKSPVKLEFIKHFLVSKPVSEDESQVVSLSSPSLVEAVQGRMSKYTHWLTDLVLPQVAIKQNGEKTQLFHSLFFSLLMWVLFALGGLRVARKNTLIALYVLIYLGVLMVYPYTSPRFLLPITPFFYWMMWEGLVGTVQGASGWLSVFSTILAKPRYRWASATVVLVLVVIAQLIPTIRWVNAGAKLRAAGHIPSVRLENKGFYETLQWVQANTPANSLIVSRKPPVTYYYTQRPSVVYPFSANTQRVWSAVETKAQRYEKTYPNVFIVEDNAFGESIKYLTPALKVHQPQLKLVFTHPISQARVWQWIPASAKP